MPKGVLLVCLYVAAVALPMVLATVLAEDSKNFVSELGNYCGLTAFAILTLQFLVAARFRWLESPFGQDIVIRFHQHLALFATGLLLLHPFLLAIGGIGWKLLLGLDLPWFIWLGKIGLILLLLNVVLSKFQQKFKLKFENWRLVHNILGPLIFLLVFLHSWNAGHDLKEGLVLQGWWLASLLLGLSLFVYHRLLRPLRLARHPYKVTEVANEAPGVWTVTLQPPVGEAVSDYYPGQFHFLTFFRGEGSPVEEHHWTISSSPTEKGFLSSTIKALGDFTETIGDTKPGDTAAVQGPFGRFSCTLHPEDRDLVFIAGGIGITPVRSMLRYLHDTGDQRPVLLLYANQDEENMVFRRELDELEASGKLRLRVVHVLSDPGDGWQGEKGLVDDEKIAKYCDGELSGKSFYLCGPAPMLKAVTAALKKTGVADQQIRTEIFSFLD